MQPPRREVSEERKAAYYIGSALMGIGLLSFLSTFVSFATHFGDFNLGPSFGKSLAIRAFGGMILMIVGSAVRGIGARGLAGSGVVIDPQQAREDLEPWSRMAGGMVHDALSETGIVKKPDAPSKTEVKVRCPACRALNDETAKFCNQCGAKM